MRGDLIFRSLARELKNPLILIARKAELESLNGESDSFISIRESAEQTLKLIDSYLLIEQTEYGQNPLPLSSVGVGSVIYDVCSDLRPQTLKSQINVATDIRDSNVMAHQEALKTALTCLAGLAIKDRGLLKIQTRKQTEFTTISVISSNFEIGQTDINRARSIQGDSYMALSGGSSESGIRLAIADILTASVGSDLRASRHGELYGISFDLLNSQQLQLV